MTKVVVGMTLSLDGYVSDERGSVAILYPDLAALRDTDPLRESMRNTGAVVMGRKAFAMADDPDWYADNYEYQTPIFVLTQKPPKREPKQTDRLSITFVSAGLKKAIEQARKAADGKDVTIIGGASTVRQCLRARLADELHLDLMPVLLFGGLRLFDDVGDERIRLQRLKTVELPDGRTHLEYRILK